MSEVKRRQQETDWNDQIQDPDGEGQSTEYEKTYRDGNAINECWASDEI